MASPSTQLSTLRPELGGSLVEFDLAMDRQGFIGNKVAPVFETRQASGTYGVVPIEQLLKTERTIRGPRGGYNRADWQFTTASFATDEHGAEEEVSDKEVALYGDYFSVEQISAQRALDRVMRAYERRVSALVYNATTFTGATLATEVTNEWDDATNATPLSDVKAAKQIIWNNTGLVANAVILNQKVYWNLRESDDMKDRIASQGAGDSILPGRISLAQIAQAFDVDYVLVGRSAYDTTDKGQTTTLGPVWSDEYCMVARLATSNDISEPCLARTFHWGADGSVLGGAVESYRDETARADIIRVRAQTDEVIVYTQCGHLLYNITT